MRILFAGTPSFAVPSLKALHAAGYDVVAVLTQPDKPQGRKGIVTPSPVKETALSLGIPVLQPARLKEEANCLPPADLMVTCAYGQILTQEILDLFPLGVWNVHASLLPAYRGAAPIARAILDGCEKTGVTIMKTERGLDTGDMLLQCETPISPRDTCGTLTERLAALGAELIVKALPMVGRAPLVPQGEGFVCKKVAREQVDFSRPAAEVSALIRGLSPAPCAFGVIGGLTLNFYFAEVCAGEGGMSAGTVLSDTKTLVVQCGSGAVRISDLQPAGGKRMSDTAFLNGRKLRKGDVFEPLSRPV